MIENSSMEYIALDKITEGSSWIGLGIAGNQAGHLKQAGEAQDFLLVQAEENAPKGMFPWCLPGASTFLGQNPISTSMVELAGKERVQPEPEIALLVEFEYSNESDSVVRNISVKGFSVLNDLSNRIDAPKISIKKNWGPSSQGVCHMALPISDFLSPQSEINDWVLACYLERGGELIPYGQQTSVSEYCYNNAQLVEWMLHQLNTQQDTGPLEPIGAILGETRPQYGIVGIGATCYTQYGMSERRFLEEGDTITVVAFHRGSNLNVEDWLQSAAPRESSSQLLVLSQKVVA